MYSSCPIGPSYPSQAPNYEITKCLGWNAPTFGTSDYFNICNNAINGSVGVPNNQLGYQTPKNGKAYCGFFAYSYSNGGCYTGMFWWEYIQGQFTQPLVAGHSYQIGFYFSLANGSGLAAKQLGVYLSQTAVGNTCSSVPLSYTPQITNTSANYLTDTLNWFLISGTYKALGGEKYLTIGNFKDTLNPDTISVIAGGGESYYFVDAGSAFDVTHDSVVLNCDDKVLIIPNVFTPNGDGVNDTFSIRDTCFTINSIAIYNRWGVKVFETAQTNNYWDGRTTSGEPCSDGTYYYVIAVKGIQGTEIKKGFIQLVR